MNITDAAISARIVKSAREVREYLINAYLVDVTAIDRALQEPDAQQEIAEAIKVMSFAFYPGDRIAQARDWDEDPDFDSEEGEG